MKRNIVFLFLILLVSCKEQSRHDLIIVWDSTNIDYTEPSLEDHFSKFQSDVSFKYILTINNNSSTNLKMNVADFFEDYNGQIKRLNIPNEKSKQISIPAKSNRFLKLNSEAKFSWEYSNLNMHSRMGIPSRSMIDKTKIFYVIHDDTIYVNKSKSYSISTKGIE